MFMENFRASLEQNSFNKVYWNQQNAEKEDKYDIKPKYYKHSPKVKKDLAKKQSQLISPVKLPQKKVKQQIKELTNLQVLVTRKYIMDGKLENVNTSETDSHPNNYHLANPKIDVMMPKTDLQS